MKNWIKVFNNDITTIVRVIFIFLMIFGIVKGFGWLFKLLLN